MQNTHFVNYFKMALPSNTHFVNNTMMALPFTQLYKMLGKEVWKPWQFTLDKYCASSLIYIYYNLPKNLPKYSDHTD